MAAERRRAENTSQGERKSQKKGKPGEADEEGRVGAAKQGGSVEWNKDGGGTNTESAAHTFERYIFKGH